MSQFSVHDAKTNLSRLIDAALDGDEVLIGRGGTPLVRLVPVSWRGKRRFGAYSGKIAIDEREGEPLPDEELRVWGN